MIPKKYLLAVLCSLPVILPAATFDWQDKPAANTEMAFRLYVPDSVPKVRAVIALVPGLDGDGRRMADNPAWQALAERTQSCLLACFMKGNVGGSYYEAEKWSGKIFLEVLKKLALESKHPEIADAPIALWGHSAGGQFNYNFACWKPERTVAFIANKGAYYGLNAKPSVRKVPGLWILGAKDTDIRVKNITERFSDGRKQGALWALVAEPNEGHGVGRSRDIGIVFIEESLAGRLDGAGKIKPIDPTSGWVGNFETKQIEKSSLTSPGGKETGWFPGEQTARLWQEIVGGAVAGSSAPVSAEGR